MNDACKGWVAQYGHLYRGVRSCGKALAKRNPSLVDIHACRLTLAKAAEHATAVEIIGTCVARGRSYGVTQRRRRRG
jgi:hypothetical protein